MYDSIWRQFPSSSQMFLQAAQIGSSPLSNLTRSKAALRSASVSWRLNSIDFRLETSLNYAVSPRFRDG